MIIGFSGFARAGKNTAAEEFAKLTEAECKHFAFARTLKQDLQPCIDALGAFADKASFKEEFRPMYVLWSRVAKEIAKNPNFWVERITPEIIEYDRDDNFSLITDVRELPVKNLEFQLFHCQNTHTLSFWIFLRMINFLKSRPKKVLINVLNFIKISLNRRMKSEKVF